jgi:hypothetical protein
MINVRSFKLGAVAVAAAGLFAFSQLRLGSIRGTITPVDAGVQAWAESATDTLKVPIVNGAFEFTNAKPGAYKIVIEAKAPYRNIAKDGLLVTDGQATDAGEITMVK